MSLYNYVRQGWNNCQNTILMNTTGLMISLACENVFSLVSLLLLVIENSKYCSVDSSQHIMIYIIFNPIFIVVYIQVYKTR